MELHPPKQGDTEGSNDQHRRCRDPRGSAVSFLATCHCAVGQYPHLSGSVADSGDAPGGAQISLRTRVKTHSSAVGKSVDRGGLVWQGARKPIRVIAGSATACVVVSKKVVRRVESPTSQLAFRVFEAAVWETAREHKKESTWNRKTRCRYDEAVFSVNYVTDQQEFVADDCAEASTCDAEQQLENNVWHDAG